MDKKTRNALIVAVILVILIVVAYWYYSSSQGGGGSNKSGWAPIKKAWPSSKGGVLSTVVGVSAGQASTEWVTNNAPDKKGAMQQADANVVCKKACDGWGKTAPKQVGQYCDCGTDTAIGF